MEEAYNLPLPSDEQQKIIDGLKKDQNVIISACAGSGKTTLILQIKQAMPEKNILIITYTSVLKQETQKKINLLNMNKIESRTYHSVIQAYYHGNCHDDEMLQQILDQKNQPSRKFAFDIIICDEVQDMTPQLYEVVCKIYKDNSSNYPAQLVIIGDEKQCIYEYKKANQRFLAQGEKVFKFPDNPYEFKKYTLSQSFRITRQMAKFLNTNCLKYERIIAKKDNNQKVRYIQANPFKEAFVIQEIKQYLDRGYKDSDIFLLVNSTNFKGSNKTNTTCSNNPTENLITKLSDMKDINIFMSSSQNVKTQEQIDNKLVITTLHQSKGLEKKVVILLNFDSSYFQFFGKELPTDELPNIFYVALTRAKECLTIFEGTGYKNSQMPFLDYNHMLQNKNNNDYIEYPQPNLHPFKKFQLENKKVQRNLEISELVRYLQEQDIQKLLYNTQFKQSMGLKADLIQLPKQVSIEKEGKTLYEPVDFLNQMAIILYLEYQIFGRSNTYDWFISQYQVLDKQLREHIKDMNFSQFSINNPVNFTKLATILYMFVSKRYFKARQLKDYDWLSIDQLKTFSDRIEQVTSQNVIIETFINSNLDEYSLSIFGTIDVIDLETSTVWKIVTNEAIKSCHKLELLVTMYLYSQQSDTWKQEKGLKSYSEMNFKILNIMDNSIVEMKCTESNLSQSIVELINIKYFQNQFEFTDEQFDLIYKPIKLKYFLRQ